MTYVLKFFGFLLRGFRRAEDGGPSVEFVIVFFPFVVLPVAGFEMGLLMTRHAMLERGLDIAIREVRLNTNDDVTEDTLKKAVCNHAGILPNCLTSVRLEMRPIDLFHSGANADNEIPSEASCVDISDPFQPARNFEAGVDNEVMIVRACGVFSPMLPKFGLGSFLADPDDGLYRLVALSAFVMEPL